MTMLAWMMRQRQVTPTLRNVTVVGPPARARAPVCPMCVMVPVMVSIALTMMIVTVMMEVILVMA